MSGQTAIPLRVAPVRETIRDLIRATDSADPSEVALAVLKGLPADDYLSALRLCLPEWVRSELALVRNGARRQAKGKRLTTPDRIRNWYAQTLGVSLYCNGEWKFLRDCSASDLHSAASERYRKATETHAEGDRWTKLALFMEENDRDTVAQIAAAELKQLMEES